MGVVHDKARGKRGQIMLMIVVFALLISLTLIAGMTSSFVTRAQIARDAVISNDSYYLAESTLEDAVYRVKTGRQLGSTDTITLSGNTATATITTVGSDSTIVSTASIQNETRKVQANVSTGSGVSFHYGIQVGEGGFTLSGGARVNGNVYANGPIYADSGVTITGSAISADGAASSLDQANDSPSTPSNTITFGDASSEQDLAQSFVPSTTGTLAKIQLYVKKAGSPGNLTVRITTDNSGAPASSSIVTGTLNASNVTASYGWVDVTFGSSIQLTAGTTYWLVFDGGSNSNKYYIAGANSGGYASGQALVGQYGGSWNATIPSGLDAYFHVYLGGQTGMITQTGSQFVGAVVIGSAGTDQAWANKVTGARVTGALYCQIGSSNSAACDSSKGDPPEQPTAISNGQIAEWEGEASAGGTFSGDKTINSSGATLGPLEITGNLSVGSGGTLTVAGTLYVHGSITIANGATVKLASAYGSDSGVIVTDGIVSVSGGSNVTGSGTSGSYIMILTTSDCPFDSSCAGSNAATLSGGADSVIFVAQNGDLSVSGGTSLQEASAYMISASGGAVLNYNSGLANMNFSSGPSGGYVVSGWKEVP